MTNDAELSIGVTDNASKNLDRIAASVRKFGQEAGLAEKDVDKAVRGIVGGLNKLSTSADLSRAAATQRGALIRMKSDLQKYQEQVEKGARAQQALARGDGRDNKGAFVSQAEIKAYITALKAVENLEAKIAAERRRLNTQGNMTPASPIGSSSANSTLPTATQQTRANAQAAREAAAANLALAKTLQLVHNQAQMNIFPPQMFRGAQNFTQAMFDMSNGTRYAMYDVARNAAIGGAAMVALGVGAVVAAARWERSFADVQRTVQGTDATLERVRQGLIGLSQEIPVAFGDLAQIASVGGQMGIGAQGIIQYTETIAKLTATTNLTADAASKALGRFKAFFAEADDPSLAVTDRTFTNLASSILKVGVNSVATESGIVNVATQISSMGSYAGFTADQVIGLSGALSSVGVPPELSRGVITRLFNNIGQAVSQNGHQLEDFARLAGVSSAEFAAAWGTDKFAYIFTDLIAGLNGVSANGGDANRVLQDLGITSVRDVPVLLRLASAAGEAGTAGSLLAQTMNDARSGWRQNLELQLQYSKISETLSARSKVLLQNLEALFATMGQASVGPVKDIVNGLIGLVKGFTEVSKSASGQILGAWAVQIGVVGGAVLLLVAGLSRIGAAAAGAGTALQAMGVSAAVATPFVRGLGLALSAMSVITLAITAAATIFAIASAAEQAINPVTDLEGALAAMQADTMSGETPFKTFEAGADVAAMSAEDAGAQAKRMGELMGYAKDETYGAGSALDQVGDSARITSLKFGQASKDFLKSSILTSEAFKRITQDESFTSLLTEANFSMDKLIAIVGRGGRSAGEAYLEGFKGIDFAALKPPKLGEEFSIDSIKAAKSAKDLLDQVSGGYGAFEATARGVDLAGEAMVKFTSATQMSEDALGDFQVQNEDAINAMADGYKQFVDTASLIGFTQSFAVMSGTIDDTTTEVNEAAEAAAGWEKSWVDAYGGASFTLSEYMAVFSRAAGEQTTQTQNLQSLLARGVPSDIITDLAAMGPQSAALVQAMVDATQPELDAYVAMYGKTGFDSMVGLAAGQLAAEQIVLAAASTLSTAQLQQLSADLSSGTPLVTAMAKWNLDAQGHPITAPVNYYSDIGGYLWRMQSIMNDNPLYQSVVLRRPDGSALSQQQIASQFGIGGGANGGYFPGYANGTAGRYTGRGGKFQPAGYVHRGEVVTPARDVDQSSGRIKPEALVRMLNGGTPVRREGGGFSGGGYAGGGAPQDMIAHLAVEDRQLLMEIRDRVGLTIVESTIAGSTNAVNANSSTRRSG